jgi:hypothetical protein
VVLACWQWLPDFWDTGSDLQMHTGFSISALYLQSQLPARNTPFLTVQNMHLMGGTVLADLVIMFYALKNSAVIQNLENQLPDLPGYSRE